MRVLFLGGVTGNSGPANANRGFMQNWPKEDELYVVGGQTRLEKLRSLLAGCLKADVYLTMTGPGKLDFLMRRIARSRGKKVIGFNHGYVPYENVVNELGLSAKTVNASKAWLDDCDLVVANSRLQMEFLAQHQPSLRDKLEYANLGIEPFSWVGNARFKSDTLRIAVTGGTRPIKANEVVAKALKLLNDSGIAARLAVYGCRYAPNPELDGLVEQGYGQYMGQLDHREFLHDLESCNVMVMNSRHESFGLSALDAIRAGSSLLVSRNCGVAGVLKLEPGDIIEDCENPEEVAGKIVALVQAPNAKRIYDRLDFGEVGWEACALRLRNICARAAGIESVG